MRRGQLVPVLRFIVNLVPSNSYLHVMLGDVRTLPMVGQWQVIVMHEGEAMLTYSEDQKACFYIYAVPRPWKSFFALSRKAPGWTVGRPWWGLTPSIRS